ncbi:phytoene desaturase family protein [Kerstersia gyiorum]|uniref:Pyridine nucleotide-disulfide oxidoreductase domain-containing protein 2 n=1 Tax=Kerstersia gyiorum TaxID=206506 RepID=A0A171KTE4_9BURK|nr:NAD(P)/FAD-dependent oxidoreductase [Kerstersia gyiorum]KKO72161.1 membrane protein [Kerstersia gyiorum]
MNKNPDADIIVVGSGMNSLVCAALLARRGMTVTVLERNPVAGGCIRTESLYPGYTHEVLSSWYPLFMGGAAYAELAEPLKQAGVEFVSCDYSTGVAIPGGPGLALRKDIADTAARMNALAAGDGDAFAAMAQRMFGDDAGLVFGLMGNDPYSFSTARLLFGEWRKRGLDGLMAFGSEALESLRRWADRSMNGTINRAMLAPWVLHGGLGPDEASSALIGKLTCAAVVAGGMPVVKGGGARLVQGFIDIINAAGGTVQTSMNVERVLVERGRAVGVQAGGQTLRARRGVVCNVTPGQLYGQLLNGAPEVRAAAEQAKRFRHGRGGMQVHFTLDRLPDWCEPELRHVPMVHVTESLEQVCLSVTEASNGWLPARPTLAVGQPVAVDVTRAPEGGWILWVQMQDVPSRLRGDAAGEIAIPADGRWNEAVREAYADRVQARLETVMPGLGQSILARQAFSPADLEAWNVNLVGGDPYSGVCSPDQFFWMRPFAGVKAARTGRTPVKDLHHIGASVHPGPGLGGQSGYLAAKRIMGKR